MANWLERAKREIPKTADQGTANTAKRTLTSVTAVPQPGKSEISSSSIGSPVEATLVATPRQSASRPAQLTTQNLIDIDNGQISAVLVDSAVGPLWLAFDDGFVSGDDIPVFFASELRCLHQMTSDELRRRYAEKRALGGGWIRDKIDEPTKH